MAERFIFKIEWVRRRLLYSLAASLVDDDAARQVHKFYKAPVVQV